MLSFLTVFLIFLLVICLSSSLHIDRELDGIIDIIAENNGQFPPIDQSEVEVLQNKLPSENSLSMESPFSTRFFTLRIDQDDKLIDSDFTNISSITDKDTDFYITEVTKSNSMHGWVNNFRFRKYVSSDETMVIFVDGSILHSSSYSFMLTCVCTFIGVTFVVLLLVMLISRRAVQPIAESYEKQKRFITDASHELKTPLTLILTNTEIARSEVGYNEWLEDIRSEGEQMNQLIKRMITLARMDEGGPSMEQCFFNLSDAIHETAASFRTSIQLRNLALFASVPPNEICYGNEAYIRQLLSILMDNAVKYCDAHGIIRIQLSSYIDFRQRKHPILVIENSYAAVDSLELEHLFDRFYRSNRARTSGEGFGIGLSIAQSVAQNHHAKLTVHALNHNSIRFRIKF